MSSSPRPRSFVRKLRKALLAMFLGVVLALLLAELGIRYAVYHPSKSLGSFGRHLRQPENFADGGSDDDFWKIQYLALPPDQAGPAENPDALTGWTGHYVKAGTYEQVDEVSIGARTPILLYGDSFCQCLTPAYECFQSLSDRSDLADRYCLLNYGVGGYGLDQMYLLLEHSIDRHAASNSIVLISVLVEDDLDRSILSFRCWPKPRLEIVNGELHEPGAPDRVIIDPKEFLRRHPIELRSFLWRYLLYKRIPGFEKLQESLRGDHRRIGEKRLLNFHILQAIHRVLEARHLRHYLLLFHMEAQALAPNADSEWQEALLRDSAQLIGMPLIDTRPWFRAAAKHLGGEASAFHGHGSPLFGHWNALGNKVAFEAIRHAVISGDAAPDTAHLESWIARFAETTTDLVPRSARLLGRRTDAWAQGGAAWLRLESASSTTDGSAEEPIYMRAGSALPTKLSFELQPFESVPGASHFVARVSSAEPPDVACTGGEVEIEVRVDGNRVWHRTLRRGEPEAEIDLDVGGHQALTLLATQREGSSECAWARFSGVRIE